MEKCRDKWKAMPARALEFARTYGRSIAYYGCVALALTAIALAAEEYRSGRVEQEALILPAADLNLADLLQKEPALVLPVNATVQRGFSAVPEWNDALALWETHTAVDYTFEGAIPSLSAGTVCTVGRSGVYGGFVEIENGEFLLRYASIEPDAALVPGTEIEKEESIGTISNGMPGEEHQGAHLHLELEQAGKLVDFTAHAQKMPSAD